MHIDEWRIDWDMQLTSKEIDLVKDDTWQETLLYYTQNDGQEGFDYHDFDIEAKRDPQDREIIQHPTLLPHVNTPADKLSASDDIPVVFSVGRYGTTQRPDQRTPIQ